MFRSFRTQLTVSFFLVIVVTPLIFFWLLYPMLHRYARSGSTGSSLLNPTRALANVVEEHSARGLDALSLDDLLRSAAKGTSYRFVLLDSGRHVLVDTDAPPGERRDSPLHVAETDRVLLEGADEAAASEGRYLRAAVAVNWGARRKGALLTTRERHTRPFLSFFEPASFVPRVIFALLVAGVLGLALSRRLLRPVDALRRAAEAMAAGDLSQRVTVPAQRELGLLAERFNTMAARVEDLVNHLSDEHEQLQAAHAELAEAERCQRELIANVSHELRTPLSCIRASVEAILDGVADDPERRTSCLRTIEEEAASLARLVDDLLTLSRLDSGQMPIRQTRVDAGHLLERCANRFEARAQDRGVELEWRCPEPVSFAGDEHRMAQVLNNLVHNSLRHTRAPGRVLIEAAPEDGQVCLRVTDTGKGIPPEHLPHVFERLYRVEPSRSKRSGGAGLGLAIAREIVEAHGGEIDIESTPGEGTTVTIRLARSPEEVTAGSVTGPGITVQTPQPPGSAAGGTAGREPPAEQRAGPALAAR
ncbi:MAG: HAMP domain-containing protein [Armatimonadetes bacterium]|nr:HAMP domain-containing protein [Armatimonadota bacterium]